MKRFTDGYELPNALYSSKHNCGGMQDQGLIVDEGHLIWEKFNA